MATRNTTQEYEIKAGDLAPDLVITLYDGPPEDNELVNLSTATAAVLKLSEINTGVLTTLPLTMDTPRSSGKVRHAWISPETESAATYRAEVTVTWANAAPQTFPSAGFLIVKINRGL